MGIDVVVQPGGPRIPGRSVIDLISALATRDQSCWLGVATAYASVSGLRRVLAGMPLPAASQWVIGLDDCLTHPSVMDVLQQLEGAEVRVAGELATGVRFHPKMYTGFSPGVSRSWLVAGSANMTNRGLCENSEIVVAISGNAIDEVNAARRAWCEVWDLGIPLSQSVIDEYRQKFTVEQGSRPRRRVVSGDVLDSDDATVDPSTASTIWIEVGNITGFRMEQLEIKAEQALFFGLRPGGGGDVHISVKLDSGQTSDIPARYRDNAMWRFNLPQSIPEVASGLRPGGGRSPYIAVFFRELGVLRLSFIRAGSNEAQLLRSRSEAHGTLGRTSARDYGWF